MKTEGQCSPLWAASTRYVINKPGEIMMKSLLHWPSLLCEVYRTGSAAMVSLYREKERVIKLSLYVERCHYLSEILHLTGQAVHDVLFFSFNH